MFVHMLKYEIGKIFRKKACVPIKYTTQQMVAEQQIRKQKQGQTCSHAPLLSQRTIAFMALPIKAFINLLIYDFILKHVHL